MLKTNFEWLDEVVRARQPRRLPNVLSREEVSAVLAHLEGTPQLVVLLLYGTGMRILECLRLRVQDIDFDLGHITIRRPKGGRDRVTMLPESTRERLQDHLINVRTLHDDLHPHHRQGRRPRRHQPGGHSQGPIVSTLTPVVLGCDSHTIPTHPPNLEDAYLTLESAGGRSLKSPGRQGAD